MPETTESASGKQENLSEVHLQEKTKVTWNKFKLYRFIYISTILGKLQTRKSRSRHNDCRTKR